MAVTMLRNPLRLALPVLAALELVAGTACQSEPGPHVVSGTLALSTFPVPPELAYASQDQLTEASQRRFSIWTRIDADGTFSLTIPPGKSYRIQFATAAGRPVLVFPRRAGAIEATFDVRGGGTPFDLGNVRYVGDPLSSAYAFLTMPGDPADSDNVECEDGIDLATGAVCVDDDDEEGAGVCDEEDEDDVDEQCEDGIDPATGGPCAGDSGEDGECVDGIDLATGAPCIDTDFEEVPTDAAVADHNLPPAIGCADDEEEDD
jgi:hypothetical protein